MKIRYAIEKEIEIPEGTEVKNIDSIIEDICKKENGLDYNWKFKTTCQELSEPLSS